MKRVFLLSAAAFACASVSYAQIGRIIDWWTYAGDSQRTGFEKNEGRFTKDDVKNFKLLWKMKLDNKRAGARSLLPPVVLGTLVGYRGFKELAFVAGSSETVWAIDADLSRMYWQQHVDASTASKGCDAALTAMPVLPPPYVFRRSPSPGKTPQRPAHPAPPFGGIFSVKPVYVVTGDGKLHRLNQADAAEYTPAAQFVPGGARTQYLNITNEAIYAVTSASCDGKPGAVWALDIQDDSAKPYSFPLEGTEAVGSGGPTIGTDDQIYVQTGNGTLDPAQNKYADSLVALASDDLKLNGYFSFTAEAKSAPGTIAASPVAFKYKDRNLIAAAGPDGRLYLLDSASFANGDHKTPLARTEVLTASAPSVERGIWGNLSSWETADGTRYVLAAVWGAPNTGVHFDSAHGGASNGFVAAFKVEDNGGKLILSPAWISRDLASPAPPVIAQGVVFALANGAYTRKTKTGGTAAGVIETPKGRTHATLYGFDAVTGEEVYSTGDQVSAPGNLSGITIANGRIYFETTDNTLQVFGKYYEH